MELAIAFYRLSQSAHDIAISKGWYEQPRAEPELLCLIHSEISECLEAVRDGNPPSSQCPGYSCAEVELADAVIRIADMAAHLGWDLGGAIDAKMAHNQTRPQRHGGKRY